jgi:hypothetical protein
MCAIGGTVPGVLWPFDVLVLDGELLVDRSDAHRRAVLLGASAGRGTPSGPTLSGKDAQDLVDASVVEGRRPQAPPLRLPPRGGYREKVRSPDGAATHATNATTPKGSADTD